MSKHTPGPWALQHLAEKILISTTNGVAAEVRFNNKAANADRIVACVNACEGIDKPENLAQAIEFLKSIVAANEGKHPPRNFPVAPLAAQAFDILKRLGVK